jgi:hypothetical protein
MGYDRRCPLGKDMDSIEHCCVGQTDLVISETQRESNFLIFDSKGQKFNQVKPQKNVR